MDYYHQFQSLESYHLSATSRPESNFLKFKVIMVRDRRQAMKSAMGPA